MFFWKHRLKKNFGSFLKLFLSLHDPRINSIFTERYIGDFLKKIAKYKQKIVRISALCTEGRNLDNLLFIFWEKRWLHKFILKFTDFQWDKLISKWTTVGYVLCTHMDGTWKKGSQPLSPICSKESSCPHLLPGKLDSKAPSVGTLFVRFHEILF